MAVFVKQFDNGVTKCKEVMEGYTNKPIEPPIHSSIRCDDDSLNEWCLVNWNTHLWFTAKSDDKRFTKERPMQKLVASTGEEIKLGDVIRFEGYLRAAISKKRAIIEAWFDVRSVVKIQPADKRPRIDRANPIDNNKRKLSLVFCCFVIGKDVSKESSVCTLHSEIYHHDDDEEGG